MKKLLSIVVLVAFTTSAFAAPAQVTIVGPQGGAASTTGGALNVNVTGGGGGGGAVTIADGADVTQGAQADTVCGTAAGTCSVVRLLKYGNTQLASLVAGLLTPPLSVNPLPSTSGGLSTFFLQPVASDNHANIKNGAGQVYQITATNNSATLNYLRLYNAGTGFNGCGSATNLVTQIAIPASTSGAGITAPFDLGLAFSTGISICVSSGYATTDTTNATASAMSVTVGYK